MRNKGQAPVASGRISALCERRSESALLQPM